MCTGVEYLRTTSLIHYIVGRTLRGTTVGDARPEEQQQPSTAEDHESEVQPAAEGHESEILQQQEKERVEKKLL